MRFLLHEPAAFLALFRGGVPSALDLDRVDVAQVWALAGLAALARQNGEPPLRLHMTGASNASRFAHAVGLRDVIDDRPASVAGEPGRTYRLRRVTSLAHVEQAAREIAELMLPTEEEEEARKTIRYVLVELMRNAIQHSGDPKGGVVAAQRMDAGFPGYPRAVVQVAVADAGVGILAALRSTYPELSDAEAALVKALEPHVSGAFGPGRTGTAYNAGMGLFFISEMAKRTAGRVLIASRDAALMLSGDLEGYAQHRLEMIRPPGTGFLGTLVAFELPLDEVQDHAGLIAVITEKARERTPRRDTAAWVRFEAPPAGVRSFLVSLVAEDTDEAAKLSREQLQPRLFRREPVALDFRHVSVCTQSFLHALLYEAIRLSWAVQTPIYVENAAPGVVTGIQLVDNYARGG